MSCYCMIVAAATEHGFVVRVQGKGTCSHSPLLDHFVRECYLHDSQCCVVVDLLGCEYLDSTFLGCLLLLQRLGGETRFQVVADSSARANLLAATRLDSFLTLIDKAPASIGTFRKIEPSRQRSEEDFGRHAMETHQALSEISSDFSESFRRIASKLKQELDKQRDNNTNLEDTVIVPLDKR